MVLIGRQGHLQSFSQLNWLPEASATARLSGRVVAIKPSRQAAMPLFRRLVREDTRVSRRSVAFALNARRGDAGKRSAREAADCKHRHSTSAKRFGTVVSVRIAPRKASEELPTRWH